MQDSDLNTIPEMYSSMSGLPYLQRMKGMKSKGYHSVANTLLKRLEITEDTVNPSYIDIPIDINYRPYVRGLWRAVEGTLDGTDSVDVSDNGWYLIGQQVNAINNFWFHDLGAGKLKLGYTLAFGSTVRTRPYEFLIFIYNQQSI